MKKQREKKSTRARIIEAAGELFAEKSFKETTIRDIVERADVNLAAVNYHFGGKKKLHDEVIRFIIEDISGRFPIDKYLNGTKNGKSRLYEFVLALMRRRHDPERPPWYGILFSIENVHHDTDIHSFFKKEVTKNKRILDSIVGDLLGPDATSEQVKLCVQSIIGQIIFQGHIRGGHGPPFLQEEPLKPEMIEVVAEHITEFSLAGIDRIRKLNKRRDMRK